MCGHLIACFCAFDLSSTEGSGLRTKDCTFERILLATATFFSSGFRPKTWQLPRFQVRICWDFDFATGGFGSAMEGLVP